MVFNEIFPFQKMTCSIYIFNFYVNFLIFFLEDFVIMKFVFEKLIDNLFMSHQIFIFSVLCSLVAPQFSGSSQL